MWDFFKDVKLELSRVNWPTRQETIKYTAVVVVFSLVMAAFLGALDSVFRVIMSKFIL